MARKSKEVDPTELVKLFGTQTAAADYLGVTKQAVGKWIRRDMPVPGRHHIKIAHRFPKQYGHLIRA